MQHHIATGRASAVRSRYSAELALTALGALIIGVLVYALDRSPGSVYFLPSGWSFAGGAHLWFGSLGGQLPEFVHVYAFSLLTATVLGASRKLALLTCIGWWIVDTLFEIGQHPGVSPVITGALPTWLEGVPFLENTAPYFMRSTFDPLDLAAIGAGAVAAYCTIAVMYIRNEDYRHVECP